MKCVGLIPTWSSFPVALRGFQFRSFLPIKGKKKKKKKLVGCVSINAEANS